MTMLYDSNPCREIDGPIAKFDGGDPIPGEILHVEVFTTFRGAKKAAIERIKYEIIQQEEMLEKIRNMRAADCKTDY